MKHVTVSAIALEKEGVWVAQGIEHDICVHAKSAGEIPAKFIRALVENICINQHLGREGLQGIKPAPAQFKELFDRSKTQLKRIGDPSEGMSLPNMPDVDIRVAS